MYLYYTILNTLCQTDTYCYKLENSHINSRYRFRKLSKNSYYSTIFYIITYGDFTQNDSLR